MSFSADEIFEIAEQIERNGEEFYIHAMEKATGDTAKLLKQLAEMESDHIKVFEAMRNELHFEDEIPGTFDPDDLATRYLKSLATGKVFDLKINPSEKVQACKTAKEILLMAISFEKDAVLLYMGMMDHVVKEETAAQLNRIIDEEKSHIIQLREELDRLTD